MPNDGEWPPVANLLLATHLQRAMERKIKFCTPRSLNPKSCPCSRDTQSSSGMQKWTQTDGSITFCCLLFFSRLRLWCLLLNRRWWLPQQKMCFRWRANSSVPCVQLTTQACGDKYRFIANVMSPTTNTHVCSGILIEDALVVVPASCVSKKCTKSEPFPLIRAGSYALNGVDGTSVVEVGCCPIGGPNRVICWSTYYFFPCILTSGNLRIEPVQCAPFWLAWIADKQACISADKMSITAQRGMGLQVLQTCGSGDEQSFSKMLVMLRGVFYAGSTRDWAESP